MSSPPSISQQSTLESAWVSCHSDDEREALLLWLPSAISVCSNEALSYGYVDLLFSGLFQWEKLSVVQYRAFESLFRHYHTIKGGLRYAPVAADSGANGSWFLSKLWRGRKVRAITHMDQSHLFPMMMNWLPAAQANHGDEQQTELALLQAGG